MVTNCNKKPSEQNKFCAWLLKSGAFLELQNCSLKRNKNSQSYLRNIIVNITQQSA